MMLRARALLLIMGVVFANACTGDDQPSVQAHTANASPNLAASQVGDAMRGRALLTAFKDSLPANSGNALRCTSCHLDNGLRGTSMPWLGTPARYPKYRSRPAAEETLERRVNECIARSLAGRMLPEQGRDMRDIIAYFETLRGETPPGALDTVKLVGRVVAGERVYGASCARCHGDAGQGSLFPAVWGSGSYSIGAGLARQTVLATFVRWNMPYDQQDTLSNQQAADVAAYILSKPRQDHPGKERDWPKGDPPTDVAYATDAARASGKVMPAIRPVLPRLVQPMAASSPTAR